MLVEFQFPFADSRFFLPVPYTGKLNFPSWPSPEIKKDFVRSFGTIQKRPSGGIPGWIGENKICEAKRALRFLPPLLPATSGSPFRMNCAFRRLFANGQAVVKYELGFSVKEKTKSQKGSVLSEEILISILTDLLNLPVRFPYSPEETHFTLKEMGPKMALFYLENTTQLSFLKEKPSALCSWWVSLAQPVIIISPQISETITLPRETIKTDGGLQIQSFSLSAGQQHWPAWIISRKFTTSKTQARNLRLYLLRHHAENQCLKTILRNISKYKITIERGTNSSEVLQYYFLNATKRISNATTKASLLLKGDLDRLTQTVFDKMNPGEGDALLEYLRDTGIRLNIHRKIEDYIQRMENPGGNIVNNINITGDNNNVVFAREISNSFNPAIKSSNNPQLDQGLDKLRELLEQLVKEVPQKEAETVTRDFKDLVAESTSPEPRATRLKVTADGLLKAAENVKNLLEPIGTIIKTILSLLII